MIGGDGSSLIKPKVAPIAEALDAARFGAPYLVGNAAKILADRWPADAVPPFALGLVLVPLVPVARRGDARSWVLALLVLVLLAVEVLFAARWHPGPVWPVLTGLGVALAAAALASLALLLHRGRSRPTVAVATGIGLAALAAGGWFVQRSYVIADLVTPLHTAAVGQEVMPGTGEKPLIKLITQMIAPQTWSDKGGLGTVEYFPLGMTLVIRHFLKLPAATWLLENFWSGAVILLAVVFQPELRTAPVHLF